MYVTKKEPGEKTSRSLLLRSQPTSRILLQVAKFCFLRPVVMGRGKMEIIRVFKERGGGATFLAS
jgi:hypothetical protein